ncbi:hypothetical protein BOC35_17055 [Burkholderia pseudomallei]|nr:hypothetical protein BOC35_17055 [Burkholderia pseudomallei]ARL22397.1 hypothetical protein BOC47_08280 [Burkholderia pseudomallei]ARL28707.1 hypothetical protein BOC48_04150 [Burkholderia pseudomallei]ARL72929.1 hypothetical protein BOC54_11500 [Burkholderia pseudomallei]ARL80154.1 hypothetical protein BOC55_13140 [Burkholderia pseudomallei]
MQAIFQIIANGADITRTIQDRVLRIRTTDKPGLEADECEIEFDDRDGVTVVRAVTRAPAAFPLSTPVNWPRPCLPT